MTETAGHSAAATAIAGTSADGVAGAFQARHAPDWSRFADDPDVTIWSPFQNPIWIESWYATLGREQGIRPYPVEVRDGRGRFAALLPLVIITRAGRTIVTFPDDNLTDYNAPLLGPAAPASAADAKAFWKAVCSALPKADLFALRKSPYLLHGRANPLSLLAGAGLCAVNGNLISVGESFADYHRSLGKPVRSEFDRSWRVFNRDAPGARYTTITDAAQAERYLDAMDLQQRARFEETNARFSLDASSPKAFYRALAARGLPRGYTYIGALECDTEIVATLIGFVQGRRIVVTRISNAGKAWAACSPGRLVLHRAMMDLHAKGVREFDFSIGNYDYKRRFKVEPIPLFDLFIPLSPRGLVPTARARIASRLRKYPQLDRRLRTIARGRIAGA